MGRIDWKKGRFDTRYEVQQAELAIRGYQGSQVEDSVEYFRFDRADSVVDDVFDEGFGVGLVFRPSVNVPALHVTHVEGGQGNGDGNTGFYWGDTLAVVTSYDMFSRTGLTRADLNHQAYLKDRILYDGLIFRVQDVQIEGQISQRDLMVSVEAVQVKPDELANDPQFSAYANQPFPNTP